MYKVIIPAVLAYMLMGITTFCLVMKRMVCHALVMRNEKATEDSLLLLDADDYGFAVMAGAVWPLSLLVVVTTWSGKWLWDALLSKIVLNSVKRKFEKENQK